MNDHQKENALRIALYLENRLSPEEREAFKRSLSEDDELRLQYVDTLMNRAATGTNTHGAVEPAKGSGTVEPVTGSDTVEPVTGSETVAPVTGTGNAGGFGEPAGDAFEKEVSVSDATGAAGMS